LIGEDEFVSIGLVLETGDEQGDEEDIAGDMRFSELDDLNDSLCESLVDSLFIGWLGLLFDTKKPSKLEHEPPNLFSELYKYDDEENDELEDESEDKF